MLVTEEAHHIVVTVNFRDSCCTGQLDPLYFVSRSYYLLETFIAGFMRYKAGVDTAPGGERQWPYPYTVVGYSQLGS